MHKYITLVAICWLNFGYGQEKAVEQKWFDCVYSGYTEAGQKEIKQQFITFENVLIEKKLLDDTSGKSYKKMLLKVQDTSFFKTLELPSFISIIEAVERETMSNANIRECQNEIEASEAFKASAGALMEKIEEFSKEGPPTAVNFSQALIETVPEEKFKYEFYKLMAFVVFEFNAVMDVPDIEDYDHIPPPPPPPMTTKFVLEEISPDQRSAYMSGNFHRIALTQKQEMLWTATLDYISLDDLESILSEGGNYYGNWSHFYLVVDPQFETKKLDALITHIRGIYHQKWDDTARHEYGMGYFKLREQQKLEIVKRYPGTLYIERREVKE